MKSSVSEAIDHVREDGLACAVEILHQPADALSIFLNRGCSCKPRGVEEQLSLS
jgi:hypothetical protein